jgi:hypothetical protein
VPHLYILPLHCLLFNPTIFLFSWFPYCVVMRSRPRKFLLRGHGQVLVSSPCLRALSLTPSIVSMHRSFSITHPVQHRSGASSRSYSPNRLDTVQFPSTHFYQKDDSSGVLSHLSHCPNKTPALPFSRFFHQSAKHFHFPLLPLFQEASTNRFQSSFFKPYQMRFQLCLEHLIVNTRTIGNSLSAAVADKPFSAGVSDSHR